MAEFYSVLQSTCWVQLVFYPQVLSVDSFMTKAFPLEDSQVVRVRLQGISVRFKAE